MANSKGSDPVPKVWRVGALCHAIADALDARFNPVSVRGEISGFSRAASGHCYFSIKDEDGQIRCAMFRRAASQLNFSPVDGELVELRGRLGVYEPRGDLQLIVESMSRAGAGVLFEQFLKLKAKLEAQGLFDPARKRALPAMPRGIGVVTSLGAAALHDVVSTLQRRVPHIPVVLAPASVQGGNAPQELALALSSLYRLTQDGRQDGATAVQADVVIDVILLVRGGGSMEDLWAFNDEQLVQVLARSPVPVVCGVGHETDFTLSDFVADMRAPTPTAAAEMAAQPREAWLGALETLARRLQDAAYRRIDQHSQQLDLISSRLGRPSLRLGQQRVRLASLAQRLQLLSEQVVRQKQQDLQQQHSSLPQALQRGLSRVEERLQRAQLHLGLLDPTLVLQRGYAWLSNEQGETISQVNQVHNGQTLRATLADGGLDLTVNNTM